MEENKDKSQNVRGIRYYIVACLSLILPPVLWGFVLSISRLIGVKKTNKYLALFMIDIAEVTTREKLKNIEERMRKSTSYDSHYRDFVRAGKLHAFLTTYISPYQKYLISALSNSKNSEQSPETVSNQPEEELLGGEDKQSTEQL